ncbi:unnamed protein product [Ixodes hexagonus]
MGLQDMHSQGSGYMDPSATTSDHPGNRPPPTNTNRYQRSGRHDTGPNVHSQHSPLKLAKLGEPLGSDHYILETTVGECFGKSRHNRLRITKWDDFRASREASATETIANLEEWTSTLLTDIQLNTTDIPDEDHLEAIDARLLHLWEARFSLHKRWKTPAAQPHVTPQNSLPR